MKKIISIALLSAVFGMVGCSTHGKQDVADQGATSSHKAKCKHKKAHHHGKFGVEKTEKDTAK